MPVSLTAIAAHVRKNNADPNLFFQAFDYIFQNLVAAAKEEVELEVLLIMIDAIHSVSSLLLVVLLYVFCNIHLFCSPLPRPPMIPLVLIISRPALNLSAI